jgi:hypothetical protein
MPLWAQAILALLAGTLGLLLFVLFELRRLAARVAKAEERRERWEAEERRVAAVRAIRMEQEQQPHDETSAALEGTGALLPAHLGAALDRLLRLSKDYQWIQAGALLERIAQAIRSAPPADADVVVASERLKVALAPGGPLARVRARSVECASVLQNLNSDGGWTPSTDKDGVRVQYRRSPTTLTVKIDALVEGVRPADTLYVWRAAELYRTWFPMVTESTELREVSEAECFVHMVIDNWFALSDMVMQGWGCDCLNDGYLLMIVRPAGQADMPEGVMLPPLPKVRRLFPSLRVLASIDILVEPLSATSVRFAYSLSVPLAPSVPLWAINVILQQSMAQIFGSMREQARRMAADDTSSPHKQQMQTEDGQRISKWIADRINPYVAALEGRAC